MERAGVAGTVEKRMRMPVPNGHPQAATSYSTSRSGTAFARPVPSPRALLWVTLLVLALVAVMHQALAGTHPATAPRQRASVPPAFALSRLPLAAQGVVSAALGAND